MKDEFFSDEPVFDLSGAAKYLGISKVQMRTLARAGRVTYSRIDRRTGDSRNAIWTPISRETPLRRGACLKEENEPRKRILFSCWPANSNRPPTPPRSYRDTRSARRSRRRRRYRSREQGLSDDRRLPIRRYRERGTSAYDTGGGAGKSPSARRRRKLTNQPSRLRFFNVKAFSYLF